MDIAPKNKTENDHDFLAQPFRRREPAGGPHQPAHAQTPQTVKAKNVVLVHGAWADGSSWSEVIPILQAAASRHRRAESAVIARGLRRGDQARAGRAGRPDRAGRAFLGGTVISQVGTDPKVTGLVYIAARAPDANEDFVALSKQFPAGPARAGIVEHDGYTKLSKTPS